MVGHHRSSYHYTLQVNITFAIESNSVFIVSQLEGMLELSHSFHLHTFIFTVLKYLFFHLPWGVPQGIDDSEACVLTNSYYIIKYSYHIPLWVAYKMNGSVRIHTNTHCIV